MAARRLSVMSSAPGAAFPSSAARTNVRLLLVGYEDRDNLGLRYLLSAARRAGFSAELALYQDDPAPLLALVERERPDVIGLSLIFQYMAPAYARIVEQLRARCNEVHITMGGHYPSFDYAEVLQRMAGLDSVVRFEGEATLVELLMRLDQGLDWRDVAGIAYRGMDGVVATPLRRAIEDLDTLDWPEREGFDYGKESVRIASILASRGCPWDCSFCSIRPFYEAQGGALRRMRKPAAVVDEIVDTHRRYGIRVFLFQDDDFLAGGRKAREWAVAIADEVVARGLQREVAFKMSCRSDEIDEDTCRRLIAGGLTHVYMGVESGDADGLLHMSKRIKPATHLRAGQVLKRLGLSFDFGFMLLEPYTTLAGVRNNIDFLEEFVGDGAAIANFCRTLPYAGTPLKAQLQKDGRLLGTPFEPDYRFLDPKLDLFYEWMLRTFHRRNFTYEGLACVLSTLLFEAHLNLDRGVMTASDLVGVHHLTAICNGVALYTLRAALDHVEATPLTELERDREYLDGLTVHEQREEARLTEEVHVLCREIERARAAGPQRPLDLRGSFDKSWTLASVDMQAR